MASSTALCCTSAGLVPLASACSSTVSASSSASSTVSFSLDNRRSALNGLRASSGRRRSSVALEKSFKRLSIRAEAEGGGELELAAPPSPPASSPAPKKKARVPVKAGRKQRVVLRFLWLEKNIGISLDQVVPGHGIIPLSPYFFWPRKDAWEELKAKLDSKKWISRKTTIILLNQATDIINLWQQNATNLL
ncbi:unnamed protein product [Calypogeia fissa]